MTGTTDPATALAAEMEDAGEFSRVIQIRDLLGRFDKTHLSQATKEFMVRDLAAADLTIEGDITSMRRTDAATITLGPRRREWLANAHKRLSVDVAPTLWLVDAPARPFNLGATQVGRDSVKWFNIPIHQVADPDVLLADLYPALKLHCAELEHRGLAGLLSDAASVGVHQSLHAPGTRTVTVSYLRAVAGTGDAHGGTSRAGTLHRQKVQLIAGPNWLITAWSPCEVLSRRSDIEAVTPDCLSAFERSRDHLVRRWHQVDVTSGHDLGTAVLAGIVGEYAAVRGQLYAWLDSWEEAFYKKAAGVERDTLIDLRTFATKIRQDLLDLSQPQEAAAAAWFSVSAQSTSEVQRLASELQRTLDDMRAFGDALRVSVELIGTSLAETQQKQNSLLSISLAIISVALLGPSLAAQLLAVQSDYVLRPRPVGIAIIFLAGLVFGLALLGVGWLVHRRRLTRL